jgi:hypothetical protein
MHNKYIYLFLVSVIICNIILPIYVHARPGKVSCDLTGESGLNVMERAMIMNEIPTDVHDLIFKESVTLDVNDDKFVEINIQVRNLKKGGAVIHTSYGKLNMLTSGFTEKDCENFESSLYYTQTNIPQNGNVLLKIVVPVNSPTVYISVLTALGYGKITRQKMLIYGVNDLTPPSTVKASRVLKEVAAKNNRNLLLGNTGTTNHTNVGISTTPSPTSIHVDVTAGSSTTTSFSIRYHECNDVNTLMKRCVEERGVWGWTCDSEKLKELNPCQGGKIISKEGKCVDPTC